MNRTKIYLIILLLALAIFYVFVKFEKETPSREESGAEVATGINPTEAGVEFPIEFPLEAGAVLIVDDSIQVAGGSKSTRTFVTTKAAEENFTLYDEWFKQSGWSVISRVDGVNMKILIGEQGNRSASVTIAKEEGRPFVEIIVITKNS